MFSRIEPDRPDQSEKKTLDECVQKTKKRKLNKISQLTVDDINNMDQEELKTSLKAALIQWQESLKECRDKSQTIKDLRDKIRYRETKINQIEVKTQFDSSIPRNNI